MNLKHEPKLNVIFSCKMTKDQNKQKKYGGLVIFYVSFFVFLKDRRDRQTNRQIQREIEEEGQKGRERTLS